MKIFIIRHGQSEKNANTLTIMPPDSEIKLTENGKRQSFEAGKVISEKLKEYGCKKTLIISSPFLRTRQTVDELNRSLHLPVVFDDKLREFDCGLFGKYTIDECKKKFPDLMKKLSDDLSGENKFFAKAPGGESASDVMNRLTPFKKILDELEDKGLESVIFVTHSGAMRAMLMLLMGYDKEWYAKEPSMKNCSIRMLTKEKETYHDHGYIHLGYKEKNNNSNKESQNQQKNDNKTY